MQRVQLAQRLEGRGDRSRKADALEIGIDIGLFAHRFPTADSGTAIMVKPMGFVTLA